MTIASPKLIAANTAAASAFVALETTKKSTRRQVREGTMTRADARAAIESAGKRFDRYAWAAHSLLREELLGRVRQ